MAAPTQQANTSEVDNLLRLIYAPAVRQQQNLEALMYRRFQKSTRKLGGKGYEFPARMGNPWSIGMRGYRKALPPPLTTLDTPGHVRQKQFYATFDIAGPDIARGRGDPEAFVDVLSDRMDALADAAFKDMNFQFYQAGDGLYANIVAVAGGGLGAAQVDVDTIKYLRVNRRVDVWDTSANQLLEAAATVNRAISALSVNAAGTGRVTFTANNPAGVAIGDGIVPETGYATTDGAAIGVFFSGLKSIVDDGAVANIFEEINRTTFPQWKAKVLANGGASRPLTLPLMQQGFDLPRIISGQPIDLVICSYNVRQLYLQLLTSQKRFMTGKMDGGFEALDYNGKTLLVDPDCQEDRAYFLNEASIEFFGVMDLEWDDTSGSILKHDNLNSGDVYYAFMKAYANFGSEQPNCNAVVTDLEVDSGYLVAA